MQMLVPTLIKLAFMSTGFLAVVLGFLVYTGIIQKSQVQGLMQRLTSN